MNVIYFNGSRLRLIGGRVYLVHDDGSETLVPAHREGGVPMVTVPGDAGDTAVRLSELAVVKSLPWEAPVPDNIERRPDIASAYRPEPEPEEPAPRAQVSLGDEVAIADLIALAVEGPVVIFLRPRRLLSEAELKSALFFCDHIGKDTIRDGIRWVFLPHDYDVFAVGEAQMKERGWMRIPAGPGVDADMAVAPPVGA